MLETEKNAKRQFTLFFFQKLFLDTFSNLQVSYKTTKKLFKTIVFNTQLDLIQLLFSQFEPIVMSILSVAIIDYIRRLFSFREKIDMCVNIPNNNNNNNGFWPESEIGTLLNVFFQTRDNNNSECIKNKAKQ